MDMITFLETCILACLRQLFANWFNERQILTGIIKLQNKRFNFNPERI